jgi:Tfp pilus assembly PilM family ATPase
MSKFLALEWDEHEIRVAIAGQRGATAVLERAFAVPLPPAVDKPHDAASIAAALRQSLAGESLRKIETLAVVGRTSIELKEMSLPPAPDDELPDMVRFQALRDFTQMSDETPLDFIPLPGDDAEHKTVLAAAISNELLSEIRATCEQAGLNLNHLVLRPCASASLLQRHHPAAGQVRMFVDLLGDEVDLTVIDQDMPLLMRTTRLPGDASQPEFCRPLFLEIRRTIASVQNKLHGRRVEKIWLCGDGPSQQTLSEMVKSELDLPTELFDPFARFELAGGLRDRLPAHHSRFAPVLGLLADAAAGSRHAIDFLDPRRRPVPKTRRREIAIAAICASALLVMFIGWTWWRLRGMDNEITALSQRRSKLDSEVRKKKQAEKDAEELNRWLAGDVPWLDVIYRISKDGPKAEDAMLTGLKADVDTKSGAKLAMDVYATGSTKVGRELREIYPKTQLDGIGKNDKVKRYPVKFKADLKIDEEAVVATRSPPTKKEDVKSSAAKNDKSAKKPADSQAAAQKTPDSKAPAAKTPDPKAVDAVAPGSEASSKTTAPKSGVAKPDASTPRSESVQPPEAQPVLSAPESKSAPSAVPGSPAGVIVEKKEG